MGTVIIYAYDQILLGWSNLSGIRLAGHIDRVGKMNNFYKKYVGKM